MLNITVLGKNKHLTAEEAIKLLNFCCEKTIPLDADKNQIRHITLDFRHDPDAESDTEAWMSHEEKTIKGITYVWAKLWVRSTLTKEATIKAICHEFVHVKHEVVEEITEEDDAKDNEDSYWSNHYEQDAFAHEDILYNEYMKLLKKSS